MAQAALTTPPPPSLQEATKNSTVDWQENLESLFHHAKDRFPDVVWELAGDEVWGHKAIVYARAPPSFQNRYFARPTETLPYPEDYAADSSLSLSSEIVLPPAPPTLLRLTTDISPALFANELEYLYTGKGFGEAFEFLFDSEHSHSHSHSASLSIASTSDESENAEALRIDKLRKDLVFMWRSRLYSDVRIALTGNFGSATGSGHEATTAIFSSHRFILVSRCSYFHTALIAWPNTRTDPNEPPTLTLPSPPFTPASIHFTLGFLYTGTLIFSHRSYDLSTAFAILRSALYLNLTTLHDEIQARIAQEMLHGLFHAFLSFPEYEALTQGRWGTGGCRCRQCARRVPRVLAFAVADDVHNILLDRGARRALVGMFGEGWATQEFAQLQPKLRESLLKGVAKRTTPQNALPLLFAAEHALLKLANSIEPWADTVRDAIVTARNKMDEVVTRDADAVFATDEWEAVVDGGGVHFDDAERVEWTMASVLRGVREDWAPSLYQTLVASILLRPHPTEPNAPLLAATSHIRVQVEQTRLELLKWLGKRWLAVRQARGFDPLEGWSLKEISDHIEVPIDDLLSPPSYSSPAKRAPTHLRPASAHPHTSKADAASDAASSMRVSLLSRVAGSSSRGGPNSAAATSHHTPPRTPSMHSVRSTASSVSMRSVATASTVSAAPRRHPPAPAPGAMSPARRIVEESRTSEKERPDSKFANDSGLGGMGDEGVPRAPSIIEPGDDDDHGRGEDEDEGERTGDEQGGGTTPEPSEQGDESGQSDTADAGASTQAAAPQLKKTLITRASLASVASRRSQAGGPVKTSADAARVRTSSAASLSPSVRARTKTSTTASASPARPGSRGSTTSTLARTRLTVKPTTSTGSPRPPRTPSTASFSRPTSRVSTHSVSSSVARPISTAETFRTASAGSSGTGTGTRSRRTSAASTLSTLSRHTTTTASTATASSTSTAGTGARRAGAPRLSTGARSPAGSPTDERARRVSGASVSSVASARSTAAGGVRATPVRKAASAGAKETHLSPAAAIAAAAKARPAAGKAATPRKIGTSASAGAVPKKVVPPVAKTEEAAAEGGEDEAGDETVVLLVPPVLEDEAKMDTGEDATVTLPPVQGEADKEADKENQTPAVAVASSPAAQAPALLPKDTNVPAASIPLPIGEPPRMASPPPAPNPPEEQEPAKTASAITVRPSVLQEAAAARMETDHKKSSSSASSSSVATLRRKGSNDTIRTVKSSVLSTTSGGSDKARVPAPTPQAPQQQQQQQPQQQQQHPVPPSPRHAHQLSSIDSLLAQDAPQGATLEIGIPCIISSKRKRFKAYARYIGEVRGETGPWVGVEVPMPLGDGAWGDDAASQRPADDRAWNDGSWGGVRYFEIGGGVGGSEWEYGGGGGGEDRAARRRRVDGGSGAGWGGGVMGRAGSLSMGVKREGDQLSISSDRMKRMRSVSPAQSDMSGTESRGLFVRPQQVLYVVDAVGTDL